MKPKTTSVALSRLSDLEIAVYEQLQAQFRSKGYTVRQDSLGAYDLVYLIIETKSDPPAMICGSLEKDGAYHVSYIERHGASSLEMRYDPADPDFFDRIVADFDHFYEKIHQQLRRA